MPADKPEDTSEKRQDNGAAAESLRKSASLSHARIEAAQVIGAPLLLVTGLTLAAGRPDMTAWAWGLCVPIAVLWIYVRMKELRAARSAIQRAGSEQ